MTDILSYKGMSTVSNSTLQKKILSGTKGPNVCQNIPRAIMPPPTSIADKKQDGTMLLCCLHQNLTLSSKCHSGN